MTEFSSNDKPALLKAIELILAEPTEIRKESLNLQKKFQQRFSKKNTDENHGVSQLEKRIMKLINIQTIIHIT